MTLFDLLMELRNEDGEQFTKTSSMQFGELVDGYDPFVATSCFHKELRRRDFEKASYWAMILDRLRGRFFVLRYMSNVSTEESHMPGLKADLAERFENYKQAEMIDVLRAVESFCNGKHWKYMSEQEDVVWQMDSYLWKDIAKHAKEGTRVYEPSESLLAKWEKKLPKTATVMVRDVYSTPELLAMLEEAIEEKNVKKALYVVAFCNCWNKVHQYTKDLVVSNEDTAKMHDSMSSALLKKDSFWNFDYETLVLHRLGFVPDMTDWSEGTQRDNDTLNKLIESIYDEVAEKGVRQAPLYALDSHTRAGKAVWLKQRKQILPNAPCTVADLRFAANWVSMLWRREAYKQCGTIDVKWESVDLPEGRYYKALWKGVYPYDQESDYPWWRADWDGFSPQSC